jgi:UPF0716 family protein affecting phage T7 exclusion
VVGHRPILPYAQFLVLLLLLIGVPILELLVFIEVARTIGLLLAALLVLATSVLGVQLLRLQGRAAIDRATLAMSQRRAPGRGAIDELLRFLGGVLLVIPGFVTDLLGGLLLLPPIRATTRRWISFHYGGRVVSFVAMGGRAAAGAYSARGADVESTAVDDDLDQLGR